MKTYIAFVLAVMLAACAATMTPIDKPAAAATPAPVNPAEFTWLGVIAWLGKDNGIRSHQVGYAVNKDECNKMLARELVKGAPGADLHPAISCLDMTGANGEDHPRGVPPSDAPKLRPESPNGPGTGVTEL
jgi:hypothetical protein